MPEQEKNASPFWQRVEALKKSNEQSGRVIETPDKDKVASQNGVRAGILQNGTTFINTDRNSIDAFGHMIQYDASGYMCSDSYTADKIRDAVKGAFADGTLTADEAKRLGDLANKPYTPTPETQKNCGKRSGRRG